MKKQFLVEKDGWRVHIREARCIWLEANPTYTHQCKTCHGSGSVSNNNCGIEYHDGPGWGCDCRLPCPSGCKMIHGVGMAKDEPEHPMPSQAILNKLEEELSKTMKEFGIALDEGIIEAEIEKQKRLRESMAGASL